MTASAVACEDGHAAVPSSSCGQRAAPAWKETPCGASVISHALAARTGCQARNPVRLEYYDRRGDLRLLVSAGTMTQACTMGNVQLLSATATRAGWVMQAGGPAGTGRGSLHSVIESYWASRGRRPRDPVTGVIR
jgi:hypothetical protein